ncbi:MAG TPA: sugar phosphate isomerase/epimerase [Fimbriimonas sp.]|nr:sugar phosphate isomerase/epimerase [Fimbriimonas sp.]
MRITTQLYTLRNELASDTLGTLKAVASFGLEYIELGGLNKDTVKDWRGYLDETGLKVSGAHYGFDAFEDADGLFSVMDTLGCKTIIMPWTAGSNFESSDAIKAFADQLADAGSKARAAGFDYLYHNHDFEFKMVDGKYGLEHLMDLVPADQLSFEVDVAWVRVAGVNEVEFINKHASRIKTLHLKDVDPSKTPQWTIAGQGTVDMPGCFAFAEANGIEFGAIELDESPCAPLDAVRESYEFFKANGYR